MRRWFQLHLSTPLIMSVVAGLIMWKNFDLQRNRHVLEIKYDERKNVRYRGGLVDSELICEYGWPSPCLVHRVGLPYRTIDMIWGDGDVIAADEGTEFPLTKSEKKKWDWSEQGTRKYGRWVWRGLLKDIATAGLTLLFTAIAIEWYFRRREFQKSKLNSLPTA